MSVVSIQKFGGISIGILFVVAIIFSITKYQFKNQDVSPAILGAEASVDQHKELLQRECLSAAIDAQRARKQDYCLKNDNNLNCDIPKANLDEMNALFGKDKEKCAKM